MEKKKIAPRLVEMRRLLLKAPLLLVPVLAILFHAAGGGKGPAASGPAVTGDGVNTTLPNAKPDKKGRIADKMDIYAEAERDSVKLEEARRQDPYHVLRDSGKDYRGGLRPARDSLYRGSPLNRVYPGQAATNAGRLAADQQTDRVLQRLQQMREMMSSPPSARPAGYVPVVNASPEVLHPTNPKKDRASTDPEMVRLDQMLDKLIRIQHPDQTAVDTERIAGVIPALLQRPVEEETVRLLGMGGDKDGQRESTGFIEIGDHDLPDSANDGQDAAIEATVNGEQTLVAGGTVALRLSQETSIRGLRIPAGQSVYGVATLAGERLGITITSMRIGQRVLPVSLQVYDLDGLAGIRVPGTVTRDVSKESANEALGGLGVASLDPGLASQAASAGIQFARSLASRKVRLVRVTLPAGYRVLLRNKR